MKRILVSGMIALSLFCVSNIDAKPKKPPPPQALQLDTKEQWCQYFGKITASIVHDRDAQIPLTVTSSRLRIIMRGIYKKYPTLPNEESLTGEIINLAYELYKNTLVTPLYARHHFEIGCLTHNNHIPQQNTILR